MTGPHGPDRELVSSAAHVFVGSLDDPVLDDDDSHHLGRVLRLRDGEIVTATDGHGRWRSCRFRRSRVSLLVTGDIETSESELGPFGVAVSVPKGDRIDWTAQKLTELGVARIVLLHSDRSVVKWDGEQAGRHLRRLREIVKAAAMQSRRLTLPSLELLPSLDRLLLEGGVGVATFGADPLRDDPASTIVAIGPEGGWSTREVEVLLAGHHATVSLGTNVLRTDTAAISAAVLLANRPV